MPRAESNSTAPLMLIEPRSGLPMPAIALTTLVLPAPDAPNSPTIGASTTKRAASVNPLRRCSMSTSTIGGGCEASRQPFGQRQRDERQEYSDDAEPQRGRIAARNLRKRIN